MLRNALRPSHGGPVTHVAGVWSVSVQAAAIVGLAKVAAQGAPGTLSDPTISTFQQKAFFLRFVDSIVFIPWGSMHWPIVCQFYPNNKSVPSALCFFLGLWR